MSLTYRGWKKSCTTLDGWNPKSNGINLLSTGAGFLPSTAEFLRSPSPGTIKPKRVNAQKSAFSVWRIDVTSGRGFGYVAPGCSRLSQSSPHYFDLHFVFDFITKKARITIKKCLLVLVDTCCFCFSPDTCFDFAWSLHQG